MMADLKNNAEELEVLLNSKLDLISSKAISLDYTGFCYVEFIKRASVTLKTGDLEENSIQDLKLLAEIRKLAYEYLDKLDWYLKKDDKLL